MAHYFCVSLMYSPLATRCMPPQPLALVIVSVRALRAVAYVRARGIIVFV